MKCAACGYSDVKAEDYRDGIIVAPGNMPPNGSKQFIPITINYEKQVIDSCHTQYHWQILYACPVCGTIKMEV